MSLDYPNRKKWLAVREFSLPRVRQVRVSGTFDAGRNQAKRIARADQAERRSKHIVPFGVKPKVNLSHMMTVMLSDRRLRQRTGKL